jgi:putative peptidoglycan lipid II flippase
VRAAPTLTVLPPPNVRPSFGPPNVGPPTIGPPTIGPPTIGPPVLAGSDSRARAGGAGSAGPTRSAPRAPGPSSTRNAAIMAAGTTVSRLSGFGRVLAVGWVLGQGGLSDAYNQANTVPNTIYELLLGGVLSATLLPVLMQSLAHEGTEEDRDAVPAVVSFLTVVLAIATIAFWVAAPTIIHFYFLLKSSGASESAEKAVATTWLRLFTPQLLFIGLITITTALLNARRRFAAVAFSPILANVVTIAALVLADKLLPHGSVGAYQHDTTVVAVVGIGTTAGYLAQLVAQLPALLRADIPLRVRWYPRHPALRTIGRLSGWTVGAVVTNQVSFTLITVLALANGNGDYSAFSYAYAFMLLPHAVVAVSIAYAVAPDLAQLWSTGDSEGFAARTSYAMRVTAVLLLPAGVGYALLARPTVVLALAHGALGSASADLTATLLSIFALGLPGFSTYLLIMRAFQSKQDTRSMFWLYTLENAVTVVIALALYPAFGVRGLTVAWIGSYTLVLPFAWWWLRRSAQVAIAGGWWARALLATGTMAAVVAATLHLVPAPGSLVLSAGRLGLVVVVGGGIFILAARALGIKELMSLRPSRRLVAR